LLQIIFKCLPDSSPLFRVLPAFIVFFP